MTAILTVAEMAEADRRAIAGGMPGIALMEKAGAAVAAIARASLPRGAGKVLVLAGPGNNGGDGWVAARILRDCGVEVSVQTLAPRGALKGDAARAAERYAGVFSAPRPEAVAEADVIVDALFGAGLSRPLDGIAAELVERMNAAGRPVVAVDVPSGLSGDTGAAEGPVVSATHTVTFFHAKPGHLLLPGRRLCGALTVADIGIPAEVLADIAPKFRRLDASFVRLVLKARDPDGHKYDSGHALILSGPLEGAGAARLAARAALRAGAGLVTLGSPASALAAHAAQLSAVMIRQAEGRDGLAGLLADKRRNAVLIGPGFGVGPETRDAALAILRAKRAAILDADALTSFAAEPVRLFAAVAEDPSRAVIFTPHDGEFARLFGSRLPPEAHASKLTRARAAARLSGAVIVLKGPDTVIAAPDGRAAISDASVPHLATAGSGDVLAGILAGLLARGHGGFEAAAAAVHLHVESGRAAGPGLTADDLPKALHAVRSRLGF